jgi:hypothetical protein
MDLGGPRPGFWGKKLLLSGALQLLGALPKLAGIFAVAYLPIDIASVLVVSA